MKVGNSKAILGVRELKQHTGIFIEHRNSFLNELVSNKYKELQGETVSCEYNM